MINHDNCWRLSGMVLLFHPFVFFQSTYVNVSINLSLHPYVHIKCMTSHWCQSAKIWCPALLGSGCSISRFPFNSGSFAWFFCARQESMFDKNDARVEQERAEAEEKRQRPCFRAFEDALVRSMSQLQRMLNSLVKSLWCVGNSR